MSLPVRDLSSQEINMRRSGYRTASLCQKYSIELTKPNLSTYYAVVRHFQASKILFGEEKLQAHTERTGKDSEKWGSHSSCTKPLGSRTYSTDPSVPDPSLMSDPHLGAADLLRGLPEKASTLGGHSLTVHLPNSLCANSLLFPFCSHGQSAYKA